MTTRILQAKFNQGEYSPEMIGRSDIDQYYGGAETLQNVVVLPQGGVTRRDGQEYLATVRSKFGLSGIIFGGTAPNGGTWDNAAGENSSVVLLTTTNISTTNPYVVWTAQSVFGDTEISFIDIINAKVTVDGVNQAFEIQCSKAATPTTWVDFGEILLNVTEKSFRVVVGGDYENVRLAKINGSDYTTNRVSVQAFQAFNSSESVSETRIMPFEFNKEQAYSVVFSDFNIDIFKEGVLQATLPNDEFKSARLGEINWTQSADTAIIAHEDIPPHKLIRGSSDTEWTFLPIVFDNKPIYDFTPGASNPSGSITPSATTGVITLTASGTPFTDSDTDVHQVIDGGGGRARVVQFLTTSTVKAVALIPFYDTTAITSGLWVYETGYEDAWSTTQGWPKSCTFHDGRLWFGGSKELPQTLWASKVGLFFDFDRGQIFDDDAINVTLDTDQVNEIVNLFSQRTLQVFTSGAEFAVQQSTGVAITPTNIDVRRQTQEGSEKGVRPSVVDGSTIFLKNGGSAVLEFLFSDVEQAYSSTQLTLASSHLIVTPVDMAIDRSNSDNEASLLYIVNSDGTMAVGSLLKGQNVLAFTQFTTPGGTGKYKNVSVDGGSPTIVVERTINGTTTRFIEQFNSSLLMDAGAIVSGVKSSITGVSWLAGETVKLRVDDVNVTDVDIHDGTETGSITAFADYSGTVSGAVLVTTGAAHGLFSEQDVVISGTTNYNATENVIVVSTTTFYIIATWVSDDATGTWTGVSGIVPVNPSSTSTVEYGFNYTTTTKDLPVELAANAVRLQSSLGKKKRIPKATLRLKNTSGIQVNGNEVHEPSYTTTGSDVAIANKTGIVKIAGILDYDETGQLSITQAEPNPLTLLAVAKEVVF